MDRKLKLCSVFVILIIFVSKSQQKQELTQQEIDELIKDIFQVPEPTTVPPPTYQPPLTDNRQTEVTTQTPRVDISTPIAGVKEQNVCFSFLFSNAWKSIY